MRFKSSVRNISTFSKLTQSLASISKTAWLRLSEDNVRFVIHAPEGTQVWANLTVHTLFEDYIVSSANGNIINLEVPLQPLHRALRSCASASNAVLRLTKRASDGVPILCLTINTASSTNFLAGSTLVTQEIPVRVLSATSVSTIEEPTAPAADVNIYLPPLSLVRNITERLNKLASISAVSEPDRVILSANMSGEFKMAFAGPEARVESKWRDLQNPVVANSQAREDHPSTVRDQEEFVEVRVDGKEWAKVLKVSTLGRKAVACFCDDLALVLYVFLSEDDEEDTILTYYMSSYSA